MQKNNWIQFLIILSSFIFIARLFYIQILDSKYKTAAEKNVIQKYVEYPYRGLIYASNGDLLTYNAPIYDLMIVPKEANIKDTSSFCQMLGISKEELEARLKSSKQYSYFLSSLFYEKITDTTFSIIQDQLVDYPGFFIVPRTVRGYNTKNLANVLGYVGEVSTSMLEKDTSNYYQSGDYTGIGGIEKSYETTLRGKRGVTFKLVDVKGEVKEDYQEGKHNILPRPGYDVHLTINLDLQKYAEILMKEKVGSVVALDPNTGEVLALVSVPTYDPNLLSGNGLTDNFVNLIKQKDKPLFNRPLQARYPPGSMFKTIQGIIATHLKVIQADDVIHTDGTNIGDLAPPGSYDLRRAITLSSNNYFYLIMRKIVQQRKNPNPFLDSRAGLQTWKDLVHAFGLGVKLGIDLPNEISGNVPSIAYYDKVYGKNRWKYSNISSLSIGQGELLITPLQMANLAAIIANRGFYYVPHVVERISDKENIAFEKKTLPFDTSLYAPIIDGMQRVVKFSSGRRGYMEKLDLCGKTSTVQNPHGRDHSGFMGFAPKDNPKIAIAAYVENAGQGGRAAVAVSSLLVEKYLTDSITRPYLEQYILEKQYLPKYAN